MSSHIRSQSSTRILGLEVFLMGTPSELDAASCALARLGTVVHRGERVPLGRGDPGRFRAYARILITRAAANAAQPPRGTARQRIEAESFESVAGVAS